MVLIQLNPLQVRRPDVAGWRRQRMPDMPTDMPITVVPDWICEVLSPTNAGTDTVTKMSLYHQNQVGHYWIIDRERETLTVHPGPTTATSMRSGLAAASASEPSRSRQWSYMSGCFSMTTRTKPVCTILGRGAKNRKSARNSRIRRATCGCPTMRRLEVALLARGDHSSPLHGRHELFGDRTR